MTPLYCIVVILCEFPDETYLTETSVTGLSAGGDRVITAGLVYIGLHNTSVCQSDRQTDTDSRTYGRTDGPDNGYLT